MPRSLLTRKKAVVSVQPVADARIAGLHLVLYPVQWIGRKKRTRVSLFALEKEERKETASWVVCFSDSCVGRRSGNALVAEVAWCVHTQPHPGSGHLALPPPHSRSFPILRSI